MFHLFPQTLSPSLSLVTISSKLFTRPSSVDYTIVLASCVCPNMLSHTGYGALSHTWTPMKAAAYLLKLVRIACAY